MTLQAWRVRRMPFPALLDRWFPAKGPCLICGVPGVLQRHRELDAIQGRIEAGEGEEEVARDYGLPVSVVERVAEEWVAGREQDPGSP